MRGWQWGGIRSENVLWGGVKRRKRWVAILVCSVAVDVVMHHEKVVYICRH